MFMDVFDWLIEQGDDILFDDVFGCFVVVVFFGQDFFDLCFFWGFFGNLVIVYECDEVDVYIIVLVMGVVEQGVFVECVVVIIG